MIVGDGAQRAAGLGALEEQRQPGDQHGRDHPAPDVDLADQDAAVERLVEQEPGVVRKQPQRIDVGAEQQLRAAFDHEGDADGGHEQDQAVLVDQRAEHVALHQERRDRHDDAGEQQPDDDRGPEREALGHEQVERAHQREAGEQHHRALREVEHAGGLEDQHEAQRDQRIEHAGEKAADELRGTGRMRHIARLIRARTSRMRLSGVAEISASIDDSVDTLFPSPHPACRRRS